MPVDTYQPQWSVTLFKNVQRKNGIASVYGGSARKVDLTPMLGEQGAVSVAKSIRSPQGSFAITLPDVYQPDYGDSPYGLIEPMDCVEIRGSPFAYQYAGTKLPLIMRGYVQRVRRSEAMSDRPARTVKVVGFDSGKLWLNYEIFWQEAATLDEAFLTVFGLQEILGLDTDAGSLIPANAWVSNVTTKVMNAKLANLAAVTQQIIPAFTVQASVPVGMVNAKAAGGNISGNLWNLLEAFADRPWNELFIRDTEAGPVVIYRPAPFYDINGKLILDGAADPGLIDMTFEDVVEIEVGRSDERVANVFFTAPGSSLLDSDMEVVASVVNGPNIAQYANAAAALYGPRMMQSATNQSPAVANIPALLPLDQKTNAVGDYVTWHRLRAQQLQLMNQDNVVFEDGSMVVAGGSDLIPGQYVQVTRGALKWKAYVTAVAHSMGPFMPWTTSLDLERGTGFLVRNGFPLPYLGEGRLGPYTPQKAPAQGQGA